LGRFAAVLLEPDAPAEPALPLMPAEPLLPVPLVPLAEPDVDEPVFAALFKRTWPVTLSLQWVAAETVALPLAEGELDD